jgi:hypothetical protein
MTNCSPTPGFFAPGVGGPYPEFPPLVSSQTMNQFYYLVAHQNAATGCTSGGDCLSAPTIIGDANINDPSTNPVTVSWYGWGAGGTIANAIWNPSSYDLLRVSATTSQQLPQPPTAATGNCVVATGILPASACDIHNICHVTDNVASASLGACSTPGTSGSSNTKKYYPISGLLPGGVALTGNGYAGTGSFLPIPGLMLYRGSPACVNSMEYFGTTVVADFPGLSLGSELEPGNGCPLGYAPIVSQGSQVQCLAAGGGCGIARNGSVAIATSATTVTVATTAVQTWSNIQVTEDAGKGTALGVTCNMTAGRSYLVGPVVPGVSFTITSSAAPTTNPACLDFAIK